MKKLQKQLLAAFLALVLLLGINPSSVFAANSTLKITGNTQLTTLTQGKSWHCNGTISSNYKLTNVTGKIYNENGTALYTAVYNPNTSSYTLKYSTIDNGLSFSKLAAGNYRYTLTATDTSGKTLTLVDNKFSVIQ